MEQFLSAKYLSGRNANQKIGVVGSTEDQKVLEVIGNVGIGTTVFEPTEKVDVRGSVSVADTITATTINATTVVVTGTGNTFAALNVTGLSTFGGNIDANAGLDVDGLSDLDELNVAGIATFGSNLDVNASIDVSTDLTVDGLSDLDELNVAGISTFGSDLDVNASVDVSTNLTVDGLSDLDELNVAGIATFGSNLDVNASIDVSTDLTVDGLSDLDELNVAGIATFASNIDANGDLDVDGHTELDDVNISGILTATTLNVTGGGAGSQANLTNLDVTGISTFGANIDVNAGLDVDGLSDLDELNVAGIATFASNLDINASVDVSTNLTVDGLSDLDELNVAGIATFASNLDINASVDVSTSLTVGSATTIDSSGVNAPTGIITASSFVGDITGDLTGVASTATKLQNARDFSITGDFVTAPAISFDGTGNVAFAATVTADSITLGTYTSGDYVQSITGTTSEIEVTGGTGEGSTPQIGLPNDVTITQDLQVNRDVQINRNLNVDGNITIGGTTATLFTTTLQVADADLILGVRTDGLGNDVATDSTANHGGIAIASTEGNPLVDLFVAGIETVPTTYKKIMWFKAGTFTGLGTDAWLSNYAVGIGSTQVPNGVRLAAGNVQVTENDISVVRNINASGIITGTLDNTLTLGTSGTGLSGSATYDNSGAATFTVTSNATDANTASTIVARDGSGNFSAGTITANLTGNVTGNLTGTATTATNLTGGDTGDIPYQSANGTTTFVDATGAGTGQVLLWNGSAPVWDSVTAASGNFGGITVQEEGVTVGTATSVGTINFVGANITATATTGANGVSTITMSDTPTFDSLTLESTDAGSAAAPEFKLYRNSASPADADYLGQIKFAGESDTGVERNYAKITGKISDATNGDEDGIIEFAHIKAGSQNISGRWNSTTLQLLNGTGFSVDGDTTLDGNVDLGNAITDTITATGRFDSGLDPSAADTYDLGSANSWRNINISGISTLGTVKISSGIVTAVSGVVTYYGDGQYLDGINTDLLSDTTPQLGGDLDLNSNNITGTGNVNITGIITATTFSGSGASLTSIPNGALDNSSVSYGGITLSLGGTDATPAFNLSDATDYPFTSLTGIVTHIVGDTTPQLGGNLDLNSNNITGTGNVNITGIVTATSFSGDGSNLTGVSAGTVPTENTTNQSQYIPFYVGTSSTDVVGVSTQSFVFNPSTTRMGIGTDSPQATLHVVDELLVSTAGAASTQRITQRAYTTDNGTLSWEGSAGQLFSVTNNLTSGSIFSVNDVSGIPSIDVDADGTIQLAPIGSTEYVGVGTTNPTAKLDVNGTLNVTGVSTFQANVNLLDNDVLRFGNSNDLQIYHDGTNSNIYNNTGAFYIVNNTDDSDIIIRTDNSSGGVTDYIVCDGSTGEVLLSNYGSQKLATTSTGIDVTGSVVCDGGDVTGTLTVNRLVVDDDGATAPIAVFKADDAAFAVSIKNDTYSTTETVGLTVFQASAGDVTIRNIGNAEYTGLNIQQNNGTSTRNLIIADSDGVVNLYHQGSEKLETTSSGINVTGTVTCDGLTSDGVVHITDQGSGGALRIGAGNDLQIYHDEGSNNTFIREVGSGNLVIQATDFHIQSTSADNMIICDADGSVDLYYNTSKKFETTTDGIAVTGIVTASSGIVTYYGDGSNLTGISAGTAEVDTTVSTTSATGVGSFATATYRSADVIAQITQGSNYQVGRYLMIHDGTTVTVVEESSVATGSMLGSFDGVINGSNAELRVTLVSAGTAATVTTKIDTVTI